MPDDDLSAEERAAIRSLERIAKKWPTSLWLFAGSGGLSVMKKDAGRHVYDQQKVVATIDIDADGGDF